MLLESLYLGSIPEQYHPQLEQQLMIIGAERALFMASSGDQNEMLSAWYKSNPELRAHLLAGWKQFSIDLANYQHTEVLPAAVGTPIQALPALSVALVGEVTSSNLALYRATAINFIAAIKTDLQTDQDFADAENMVKFCDATEKELDTVKRMALAQTSTIDELFRTIDGMKEAMKAKRLMLDKLVKARKDQIRAEIVQAAGNAMTGYLTGLNKRLGKAYMLGVPVDFAGAVKGKRTVSSLQDAVDTELARAKIDASAIADRISLNLTTLRDHAANHTFLFADEVQIVLKAPDDCMALVKLRIADHRAAEEKRLTAERERIRGEEVDRLEREEKSRQRKAQEDAAAQSVMQALSKSKQVESIDIELLEELEDVVVDIVADMAISRASDAAKPVPVVKVVIPVTLPSFRIELNGRLDGLNESDLQRVLSFVKSRWPDAQAA